MLLQRITKGVDKATAIASVPAASFANNPTLWMNTALSVNTLTCYGFHRRRKNRSLSGSNVYYFYRRLSCISENSEEIDGVTVIMRYTLRLLTIQQFERACALICACEHLRIKHRIPGGEINIGLWIGSDMTPNRITQAKDVLHRLRNNEDIKKGNPVQITKCPWCNTKLDLNSYEIKDQALVIRCADNSKCAFHNHLPIYVATRIFTVRAPRFY